MPTPFTFVDKRLAQITTYQPFIQLYELYKKIALISEIGV
jgi:hypothetical protein